MQDSSSPTFCLFVTNTAFVILGDTAIVLCVAVSEGGVATDTGRQSVYTNVPTHVVQVHVGTIHFVVADYLTLDIGGV